MFTFAQKYLKLKIWLINVNVLVSSLNGSSQR